MVHRGQDIDEYSKGDKTDADPERVAVSGRKGLGLERGHLVQKQPKPGHDKSKSHQRKSGSNPRKEGPLRRHGNARVAIRRNRIEFVFPVLGAHKLRLPVSLSCYTV